MVVWFSSALVLFHLEGLPIMDNHLQPNFAAKHPSYLTLLTLHME